MTSLAAELLEEARRAVARGWCQRADAVDSRGGSIEPWSPLAARWSLEGALVRAWVRRREASGEPAFGIEAFGFANLALVGALDGETPVRWNDAEGRTQDEAVAALDDALAQLFEASP